MILALQGLPQLASLVLEMLIINLFAMGEGGEVENIWKIQLVSLTYFICEYKIF